MRADRTGRGERNEPSRQMTRGAIMEHDRPRWRIRISTLMLLIIIAALAMTLVSERWKRAVEARRVEEAALDRALAEANAALAKTRRTQAPSKPTPAAPQQGRPNPTRGPEDSVP